jgi:integrase
VRINDDRSLAQPLEVHGAALPGKDWTTYELRHSFVSLVSDQLGDLRKVADLAGHADTKTTEGYRHTVRAALPHAVDAWDRCWGARARCWVAIVLSSRSRRRSARAAAR